MAEILQSILFGVVQGLTEFLPVSSSGHLVLLHSIADLRISDDLAFDVALHLGTLVAVVVYFRTDLSKLTRGWLHSLHGRANVEGRMAWLILVGTIPAVLVGWWLEAGLTAAVRQPGRVAIVLIIGGVLLWAVDRWSRRHQPMETLSFWSVVAIGIGQAVALMPGVSRSGATIIVGRLVGLSRLAAARFSFLLSVPVIVGAGIKQAVDLRGQQIDSAIFLFGAASAAVVGYFAIRWLLAIVQRHSYAGFAIYRIVIGIAAGLYFWR